MDINNLTKKYSNGEITIVWQPGKCIHSTKCWNQQEGLRSVFNPAEKPWIKPEGASTGEIIVHINKCPSGALSYYKNDQKDFAEEVKAE